MKNYVKADDGTHYGIGLFEGDTCIGYFLHFEQDFGRSLVAEFSSDKNHYGVKRYKSESSAKRELGFYRNHMGSRLMYDNQSIPADIAKLQVVTLN